MPASAPLSESLSTSEIEGQFRALSPADWARALSLARMHSVGLPDWTPETLLSEAFLKLQTGERVWRRGVHPLVTLKLVMHSIAGNERKKSAKGPIDRFATVDTGDGDHDDHDGPPGAVTADERTPEEIVDGRSQLAAITKLIAGDEDAELVLLAWCDGLHGKDAAAELGFDMKRHDAARKRLLRRLEPVAEIRKAK